MTETGADILRRFHQDCAAASWPEPLWHAAVAYFKAHDISILSYHHLPPLGAPDEGRIRVVAEGFPEEWVHSYIREKKYRIDPIPAQASVMAHPFLWSEVEKYRDLNDVERAFYNELRATDFGNGLALAAFGPGGRNGYFGIGFGPKPRDIPKLQIGEFQSVCQSAHLLYCRMVANSMPPLPSLSQREEQILHWVAQGKSNSVIAEIMGLSPHTIDAHLRRLFLKLGTSDRISAAIRGLGSGLIRGY